MFAKEIADRMRILVIGAGGVGESAALIAARRDFFELWVVSDYEEARAQEVVIKVSDSRFVAELIDASNAQAVTDMCKKHGITHVLNAVDPRFVMPIFDGAFAAGAHYMDTAMSLSAAHPTDPFSKPGLKLGDEQFAAHEKWHSAHLLALCGMGVEPGLANVLARYASDHLFSEIDEIGIRDGANLLVEGFDFAPSFSIWTTIEECLNPPVVWTENEGWFTTEPFSEPEIFDFPEGIGPVRCFNVEHEEVLLIPRFLKCKRVTFKLGLGDEFIDVLKTLHRLGLDRTQPVNVKGQLVSPRDLVAAALPDPAKIGDRMTGKTCAGTWITGLGQDGHPREVYLYHVADNEWTMREYGTQAVVWQTALNPVIALELLGRGVWQGSGVLGPESFDAVPYLDMMRDEYGQPIGIRDSQAV
jgi:saccharopine dehydrogenase (NAD+, L-lysine forming)